MKKSKKRLFSTFILFLILFIIVSTLVFYKLFEVSIKTSYKGFKGEKIIKIKKGMSVKKIAALLKKEKIIRSKEKFILAYRIHFKNKTLKSGEFLFDKPISIYDALNTLTKKYGILKKITIKEGYDIFDIAELFEEKGICSKKIFFSKVNTLSYLIKDIDPYARTLEGYLFPETYKYASGIDCDELIRKFVSTFKKVFYKLWNLKPESHKLTKKETIIMASLIEKETSKDFERPIIASVFYNRLKRGMLLQCDPTIIYSLKLEGKWEGRIRTKNIKFNHPYNTYVFKGLPPGPICNPGKASIRAAISPAKTKYLYFVSKNDGTHYFSRSLKEHNRAVYIYQIKRRR